MDKRLKVALLAVFAGTSCWTPSVYSADSTAQSANMEPLVVEMEEISVFDVPDSASGLWSGQRVSTWGKGRSKVKTWPVLKSDKPICGELPLDTDGDGERERKLSFAIDESRGTGTGYDKMYFDINGDSELGDIEVFSRSKAPPAKLVKRSSSYTQVVFEAFKLAFGEGGDKRNIEIMANLAVYSSGSGRVSFIPTKCRKGIIPIDAKEYSAYLGSSYDIAANYDSPRTALYIGPAADPKAAARWWGGYSLNATHNLGGRFYSFSATARGDKLTVTPYTGDVGIFRIGPGDRKLRGELTMRGSLASEETSVAVGGQMNAGWPEWANECVVPVGDYLPNYLRARYGGAEVFISNNYHSQAEERNRGSSRLYGIEVRKDKPYVLDFSNEPEVMFTTVTQGMKVRAGQELEVKAVLIDPRLDIMFRGIHEIRRGDDRAGMGKSLEPRVVIKRSNGQIVGGGVMPFG